MPAAHWGWVSLALICGMVVALTTGGIDITGGPLDLLIFGVIGGLAGWLLAVMWRRLQR